MSGGAVVLPRPTDGERILVSYDAEMGLGDLVCTEPMVRGLRQAFPHAEIRWRGYAGNAAMSPALAGRATDDYRPTRTVRVVSFRNMPPAEYAKLEALPYLVDHMCSFAGVAPTDRSPRLLLGAAEEQFVAALQLEKLRRPLVAMCCDVPDPFRGWPLARYQALALHLTARGATVIEVGARQGVGVGVDMVGQLSARRAAAVISRCDLYVGNSSGLLQYAQAGAVPCLAFFSSALPARFVHDRRLVIALQQRDLACINCMTEDYAGRTAEGCRGVPEAVCMTELSLSTALASVDEFFSEYLVDCPRPGEEGSRARAYRTRNYAGHAAELLRLGYPARAGRFYAFAGEVCAGAGHAADQTRAVRAVSAPMPAEVR